MHDIKKHVSLNWICIQGCVLSALSCLQGGSREGVVRRFADDDTCGYERRALFSNKCARLFKTNRVVLHIHAEERVGGLVAAMVGARGRPNRPGEVAGIELSSFSLFVHFLLLI